MMFHPALGRFLLGISVAYLSLLLLTLFRSYEAAKDMQYWIYPSLKGYKITDQNYAANCSDVTLERLWSNIDFFAFTHLCGWAYKALLIRHFSICWTMGFVWEITEIAFYHLSPDLEECWWDAFWLDAILCNGLGIWLGIATGKALDISISNHKSFGDSVSIKNKLHQTIQRFTPITCTRMEWLGSGSHCRKVFVVAALVTIFTQMDLNTFLLNRIFGIPIDHPLCLMRVHFVYIISAPSVQQLYAQVSENQRKGMGVQLRVFLLITIIEAIICIKFSEELYQHPIKMNIFLSLFLPVISAVICVLVCSFVTSKVQNLQFLKNILTRHKREEFNHLKHDLVSNCRSFKSICNENDKVAIKNNKLYQPGNGCKVRCRNYFKTENKYDAMCLG